jgi:hypothetical protein
LREVSDVWDEDPRRRIIRLSIGDAERRGREAMMKRILFVAVGLALVAAFGVFLYRNVASSPNCDVCYRPLHKETYYRIHLSDGEVLDVCCPRCGLRFQEGRHDVVRTEVTDFDTRRLVHGDEAYYVEGSPVHFCSHAPLAEDRSGTQYEVSWDRCLPSLIAFQSREAAVKFQDQNGGVIKTYDELLEQAPP